MKGLVIGLGISGRSAVNFLMQKGIEVIGVDSRPDVVTQQENFQVQHDSERVDFSSIDLVVLSPGISQEHPLCIAAKRAEVDVIGEMELAARYMQQPCIGITGTNGKTTVTLLVEHVLNTVGIASRAVGNVGIPITSELPREDVLVIELSSFQLETLVTPIFDVAAVLNVTPDHLDRYPSMNEYVTAKARIKDCLKPDGMLYIEDHTLKEYGSFFKSARVQSYTGRTFEEENQRAAFLLCQPFGVEWEDFTEAVKTFRKPPHRLEFVCKHGGVYYYNDSKATNIDAVVRAVEKMSCRVVLIVGGLDKGAPYTPWVDAFAGKVSAVCAIGQAAQSIEEVLSPHFPVFRCESLEHAVDRATQYVQEKGVVLLSPGCASFDMFRNFEERGEAFKRIVAKRGS